MFTQMSNDDDGRLLPGWCRKSPYICCKKKSLIFSSSIFMVINFGFSYRVKVYFFPQWLARFFQYHLSMNTSCFMYYYFPFLDFSLLLSIFWYQDPFFPNPFQKSYRYVCLNQQHILDPLLKLPQETLGLG